MYIKLKKHSFFQQHYRWLHVYNDSVIQKHMSRVSSSLKNREKI